MASDLTEPVVRAILESAEEYERYGDEYISLATPQVRALAQDWLARRAPTDGRRLTEVIDSWTREQTQRAEIVKLRDAAFVKLAQRNTFEILLSDARAEIERLTKRVRELRERSKTAGCERCDRAGQKCMRCIG